MMKVERIFVDVPIILARHRQLDPDRVADLVESIKRVGLLHPIRVYTPDNSAVHLVSGLHRLEAAKALGWEEIDAVFMTGDDLDREMAEIAENLHRSELTALERSEHVERWRQLEEAKAKGAQVGPPQAQEAGVKKTARALGVTPQEVQRSRRVAGIAPEAKEAAREAGLADNQSALLKVAAQPPERQVATVHQLKSGPVNVKTWRDDFERLWARGTEDDHQWAREVMYPPTMDERFA